MILLWLGLVAFLQSTISLVPDDISGGAAWVQLLLIAVIATVLLQSANTLRRVPAFGIRGQWLILPGVIALFLAEGGVPGEPGGIADLIGLDPTARHAVALAARLLIVTGLWEAMSNLASSRQRSLRAMEEASLHGAITELAMPITRRPRGGNGSRSTRNGLTAPLRSTLEQIGDAHRALRNKVMQEPDNIAARLALHRRLCDDPSHKGMMLEHAADFISALRQGERADMALSIAAECARFDQDYFPPNDEALELAHLAVTQGQHAVALRLLRHFDVRNPGHPDIPRALMLSARALGGMGRNEAAQGVLGGLVERYPDDPLAADAIALSARLAIKR